MPPHSFAEWVIGRNITRNAPRCCRQTSAPRPQRPVVTAKVTTDDESEEDTVHLTYPSTARRLFKHLAPQADPLISSDPGPQPDQDPKPDSKANRDPNPDADVPLLSPATSSDDPIAEGASPGPETQNGSPGTDEEPTESSSGSSSSSFEAARPCDCHKCLREKRKQRRVSRLRLKSKFRAEMEAAGLSESDLLSSSPSSSSSSSSGGNNSRYSAKSTKNKMNVALSEPGSFFDPVTAESQNLEPEEIAPKKDGEEARPGADKKQSESEVQEKKRTKKQKSLAQTRDLTSPSGRAEVVHMEHGVGETFSAPPNAFFDYQNGFCKVYNAHSAQVYGNPYPIPIYNSPPHFHQYGGSGWNSCCQSSCGGCSNNTTSWHEASEVPRQEEVKKGSAATPEEAVKDPPPQASPIQAKGAGSPVRSVSKKVLSENEQAAGTENNVGPGYTMSAANNDNVGGWGAANEAENTDWENGTGGSANNTDWGNGAGGSVDNAGWGAPDDSNNNNNSGDFVGAGNNSNSWVSSTGKPWGGSSKNTTSSYSPIQDARNVDESWGAGSDQSTWGGRPTAWRASSRKIQDGNRSQWNRRANNEGAGTTEDSWNKAMSRLPSEQKKASGNRIPSDALNNAGPHGSPPNQQHDGNGWGRNPHIESGSEWPIRSTDGWGGSSERAWEGDRNVSRKNPETSWDKTPQQGSSCHGWNESQSQGPGARGPQGSNKSRSDFQRHQDGFASRNKRDRWGPKSHEIRETAGRGRENSRNETNANAGFSSRGAAGPSNSGGHGFQQRFYGATFGQNQPGEPAYGWSNDYASAFSGGDAQHTSSNSNANVGSPDRVPERAPRSRKEGSSSHNREGHPSPAFADRNVLPFPSERDVTSGSTAGSYWESDGRQDSFKPMPGGWNDDGPYHLPSWGNPSMAQNPDSPVDTPRSRQGGSKEIENEPDGWIQTLSNKTW
ncbi:hypothetical protein MKZ38_007593 [Zalerion maritima]|uniref:Uncharacterized protein n=1 Tax=Zalerion maritima TaxID=339359 RepID=A0AAD5RUP7_9PEZI|nr:hypothetical protein MKZ38_007593 [Zalerion maritima]